MILESITICFQRIHIFVNTTIYSACLVPVNCVIIYYMADCVADQTALDLVRSDELRLILAAYQDKVRAGS